MVIEIEIVGELPGLLVDEGGDALETLACAFKLAVHHLKHARNGAEAVAVRVLDVAGNCGEAFGIPDAYSKFLELIVHCALIYVAEGQEADHPVLVSLDLTDGVAVGVGNQVVV